MMHRMRQVWRAVLPVDNSGRVYVVGSVPVLHPEVQTVVEMLEGWRIQQLFGDLDHGTIEGRCQMCSPRSRCHDRPARYSPAHVSSRSHHAGPNSRVRLRRVPTNPDGSNARTILQIPQFRIWRLTGKFLRYHVVAQYISPTPESWSRRASK